MALILLEYDPATAQTDREKAIRIGKFPIGSTSPSIYMCGECRAIVIGPDQGICTGCDALLRRREHQDAMRKPVFDLVMAALTALLVLSAVLWLSSGK